jgi:hypothetical protein
METLTNKRIKTMSLETDGQIFQLEKSIVKSIDKLNENLLMIAYQLYVSNLPEEYATIKNFLTDKEELKKGG